MSNPAVTKLRKLTIGSKQIWLDDNIGESVHLHINDTRIDFTLNEFRQFCDELCNILNVLVDVDGFDYHDIDPQFFETTSWEKIENLKDVDYKTVQLSNLKFLNEKGDISVPIQRFWFDDEDKPKEDSFKWTFIGQTFEAIHHPFLWAKKTTKFLKEKREEKEKESKKARYLSVNKKDHLNGLQILDSK